MRERENSLLMHQKAFKRAKTLAERIELARAAARDPDFLPVRPESMNYNVAEFQNGGKGALCLDVDDVLLGQNRDDSVILNDAFLEACLNAGYTEVYLVTSMSLKLEEQFNRVDLIAYLALAGISVKGVVTEADTVREANLGDFYIDYYASAMANEISEPIGTKQASRKALAEGESSLHLGEGYAAFGKKVMMLRKLLKANPDVKRVLFADDSIANLNGMIHDYLTKPYHKAIISMLPIAKISSEINQPTTTAQYLDLLNQFEQNEKESDEAYAARMKALLFKVVLLNLEQQTHYGQTALPQYEGFCNSLKNAPDELHKKKVNLTKVIDKIEKQLASDYLKFEKIMKSSHDEKKPAASVARAVTERFDTLKSALSTWKDAFESKVASTHKLSKQSLFAHAHKPKDDKSRKPPRKTELK